MRLSLWARVVALAGCSVSDGDLTPDGTDRDSVSEADDSIPEAGDAGDVPPEVPAVCTRDEECDDGDPCTLDRCEPEGSCAFAPAPMGRLEMYVTSRAHDGTAYAGAAQVLKTGLQVERVTLDGPTGEVATIGTPIRDGDGETGIAWTGSQTVLVTNINNQLFVRTSTDPSPPRLFPGMGGHRIDLAWTGSWLVATFLREDAIDDATALTWLDADGEWLAAESEPLGADCPNADVPFGPSGTVRNLPDGRPVGFTATGEAIYLSVREDGTLVRLVASPSGRSTTTYRIDRAGPLYYHSFVGAMGGGRTGALWVQTDDAMAEEHEMVFGVFDDAYVPVAEPGSTTVAQQISSGVMAMAWCEGRFVGTWYDGRQGGVVQFAPDGTVLAGPTTFGGIRYGDRLRVVCLPHGVVIVEYDQFTTLRCPGA